MTKEAVFIIFFLIFSVFAGDLILNGGYINKNTSCGSYQTEELSFDGKSVNVEISDNDCKRTLGFSGRKELKKDTGMIFVFDDETPQGIWMKDMNFPIDILWINSEQEIVLIEKNISPKTYPAIFGLDISSKFVIELPSGFTDLNKIKTGDKISISAPPSI